MAGVIASKVRKQRSALKADANRDAETQNKYLNVGNVYFSRLFWIHFLYNIELLSADVKWSRGRRRIRRT